MARSISPQAFPNCKYSISKLKEKGARGKRTKVSKRKNPERLPEGRVNILSRCLALCHFATPAELRGRSQSFLLRNDDTTPIPGVPDIVVRERVQERGQATIVVDAHVDHEDVRRVLKDRLPIHSDEEERRVAALPEVFGVVVAEANDLCPLPAAALEYVGSLPEEIRELSVFHELVDCNLGLGCRLTLPRKESRVNVPREDLRSEER